MLVLHSQRRPQRGFTLVELLVALVLFDCALLAFAGNAALLTRAQGVVRRRDAALAASNWTIARFRAADCPSPASGHRAIAAGVDEWWEIAAAPDSARRLRDSVEYQGLATRSTFVVRAALVC